MTAALIPAFILLTALFSVLHGANRVQKGWCIVFHAVACTVAAWMLLPLPYALAGGVAALLYWAALRRGKQARAELDFMSGKIWVGLDDISRNYWPALTGVPGLIYTGHYWMAGVLVGLMFLPALVSAECNVRTEFGADWQARDNLYVQKHNKPRFWEMRRATEIASGITGGFWSACLVITAAGV